MSTCVDISVLMSVLTEFIRVEIESDILFYCVWVFWFTSVLVLYNDVFISFLAPDILVSIWDLRSDLKSSTSFFN